MLGQTKQIKGRSHTAIQCLYCEKIFWKRTAQIFPEGHCCSRECQRLKQSTGEENPCGYCGEVIYRHKTALKRSKSGNAFCNRSCATSFNNQFKVGENHPGYKGGSSTYRQRALDVHGASCSNQDCPFNNVEVKMLDVHHLDKNRKNNSINNLQVLCVWCHALETRKDW